MQISSGRSYWVPALEVEHSKNRRTFEGYGPSGVGMLIQVVTTIEPHRREFRHLMSQKWRKHGEAGAVGGFFPRRANLTCPKEARERRQDD